VAAGHGLVDWRVIPNGVFCVGTNLPVNLIKAAKKLAAIKQDTDWISCSPKRNLHADAAHRVSLAPEPRAPV
jgi:hypothetical protein